MHSEIKYNLCKKICFLIIIFFIITIYLFAKCREGGNNPLVKMDENKVLNRDTIKEKILHNFGSEVIRFAIYDMKDEYKYGQNQIKIDRLMNKFVNQYDSMIISTFTLIRTPKDTLTSAYKLPVGAASLGSVSIHSNIKELDENSVHLKFRLYCIDYLKIKPIERYGKVYKSEICLSILTDNTDTDRQIWVDISLLHE